MIIYITMCKQTITQVKMIFGAKKQNTFFS